MLDSPWAGEPNRTKSPRRDDALSNVIRWMDHVEMGDDILRENTSSQWCGDGDYWEHLADDVVADATVSRSRGSPISSARRLPSSQSPLSWEKNFNALPSLRGTRASSSRATPSRSPWCCDRGAVGIEPRSLFEDAENEEEEWEARQKMTGVSGRLVSYEIGENPQADFLLRGGYGSRQRRIMVAAVTDEGKAYDAGVRAGDVLVSINGKKDFVGKSADFVHACLTPPVVLVFIGFVGKLQAEVRLNYAESIAGVPSQKQVLAGHPVSAVKMVDEVVFKPSLSPLYLATDAQPDVDADPYEVQSQSRHGPSLEAPSPLPKMPKITSTSCIDLDDVKLVNELPLHLQSAFTAVDLGVNRQTMNSNAEEDDYMREYQHGQKDDFIKEFNRLVGGCSSPFQGREDTASSVASQSLMDSSVTGEDGMNGVPSPLAVYELQVTDARYLVQRALSRVKHSGSRPRDRVKLRGGMVGKSADEPLMERVFSREHPRVLGSGVSWRAEEKELLKGPRPKAPESGVKIRPLLGPQNGLFQPSLDASGLMVAPTFEVAASSALLASPESCSSDAQDVHDAHVDSEVVASHRSSPLKACVEKEPLQTDNTITCGKRSGETASVTLTVTDKDITSL